MSEHERVAATCPACSPDLETVHEVLNPGGQATVRCTECGHVHKTRIESTTTVETDVVVSQEGESFSATADVPVEETLVVGEEFLLDDERMLATVRITSLELPDGGRVEEADGGDVRTIWGRAVDNVAVDVTVHPKEDTGDETRSVTVRVPGDHEFVVGETESHGDEEFTVEQLLVRDDAAGYDREQYDRRGDAVAAKDLKRAFARDETGDAWSAW
ncbi:MAG: HVO_0476 family zinc finger protein [Halobacteriales archaeon]